MGKLVDGQWVKKSVITSDDSGKYDREPRSFLHTISENHDRFTPESGRYHLYVSYACPWAHRTLIYRHLKSLQDHITVSVVHPDMLDMGWTFNDDFPGATGDPLYHFSYLMEVYQKADPKVSTSVTVPVLWDKKNQTIVNNESSQIIRIFNKAFNSLTGDKTDFYPSQHQSEIDEWNDLIYRTVNNGVYKAGFARNQKAYEEAVHPLFETLEKIDHHLQKRDFLVGDQLTEADIRLMPTLIRFDPVYYIHFKCSFRKISEFKNLSQYFKRLFAMSAFAETTAFEHFQRHYYYSHPDVNPCQIVPYLDKNAFSNAT